MMMKKTKTLAELKTARVKSKKMLLRLEGKIIWKAIRDTFVRDQDKFQN